MFIYIYKQKQNICLDRPWDKSTRAVVYELPDVASPAGLFDKKENKVLFL